MNLENKNNEELMQIFRDGNSELAYLAFEVLYRRSSGPLYSFLLTKTKNKEDAQDLLQKTYFKIHQCQNLYDSKFKFEQWLYTIAKNLTLDEFRKINREKVKLENFKQSSFESLEELNLVNLDSLVGFDRELLELKFVDEMSYLEISKILNKSEVSLRKMVSRILKRLGPRRD